MTDPTSSPAPQAHGLQIDIDLDALARNWGRFDAMGRAEAAAVIKADAYGLGADRVLRRLWLAGARTYFVATLEEAAAARRVLTDVGGREARVLVLNSLSPTEMAACAALSASPILNTPEEAAEWSALRARTPDAPAAALHIDTGMNRLGLSAADAQAFLATPGALEAAGVDLVMSHLACASAPSHPMNAVQRSRFDALVRTVRALAPDTRFSLANTGGAWLGEAYAYDLVRPGIGLYGGSPFDDPALDAGVEPVVRVSAPVLQVRDLSAGDTVGYGAEFAAPGPRVAATVAAGYADGVLRSAAPGGYAVLNGARAPYLGRVSMDLIVIDVTNAPRRPVPGDRVELLGGEATLEGQAAAAGTINYELLTGLSPRAQRRYLGAAS